MATGIPARHGRSAVIMAAGVAVVGLSGFGFLAIVGHTLSGTDAVTVTALYMIINIIGPGLFYSLEQETNRVVSSGLNGGVDPTPGLRGSALVGLLLTGATAVLVLAISPILVSRNFGGHALFVVWLMVGIVSAALVYFVRGVLAGCKEFGGYSMTLIVEGLARVLPCAAIAAAGGANQDAFGALFAVGGVVATLAVLSRLRRWLVRFRQVQAADEADTTAVERGHRFGRIARGLTLLATATMLAQLVANLAPLVVTARLIDEPAVASSFAFAFVLSRVPLLLYGPLQSMMLPVLAAAAVRGDHGTVWRVIRAATLAVAGLGVLGTAGSALFGPWVVVTFFGAESRPSGTVMALLAISTMLLLVSLVFQPALVALGKHHTVSLAWVSGTVALVVLLAVSADPIAGAVVAQLAGPAVVVAIATIGLVRATRPAAPEPAGADAEHPHRPTIRTS